MIGIQKYVIAYTYASEGCAVAGYFIYNPSTRARTTEVYRTRYSLVCNKLSGIK